MYYSKEAFMENYFSNQDENMFKDVDVLVYVFDVENSDDEFNKDLNYYVQCLNAIYEYSPSAKIFCFIHKMDLVAENQKDKVYIVLTIIKIFKFNNILLNNI